MASPTNSGLWSAFNLLICMSGGRDIYSFLAINQTQAQVLEKTRDYIGITAPAMVNVEILHDDAVDAVIDDYRNAGRILED